MHPGGLQLALLAGLCAACSDVYVGSDLLWSARHETADLSEWSADGSGASAVDTADGSVGVSEDFAHTGRFSVKLQKVVTPGTTAKGAGPRLMRFGGLPQDAFYSAWYLVPRAYTTASYWTILQFDSHTSESPVDDRGIDVQLRSLPDGDLVLQAFSHDGAYLLEPLANPAPVVAVGAWFHVEVEFRAASDATGKLVVWLDGRRIYDLGGRPTTSPDSLEFMLCNMLVEVDPSPVDIYVDDVAISRSRATPNAQLGQ